jgi:DNA-binding transcriptional regulator YiaG
MSALTFRNIDVSPADPVSGSPIEAIQTALERGGLSDWRRLVAAVDDEPWGPVARRIEDVLAYSRPYGIAEAMERVIARARAKAEQSKRQKVSQEVKCLIDKSGLPRADFASRIGTSASRLSTYANGRVTPFRCSRPHVPRRRCTRRLALKSAACPEQDLARRQCRQVLPRESQRVLKLDSSGATVGHGLIVTTLTPSQLS